jgi:biopolymer transport protein ExbB
VALGSASRDSLARSLAVALAHRGESFAAAMLRAANLELKRWNRGLPALDTVITLAPLLGLLGTVTGMIGAFGLLGSQTLDAPAAITGGIAEALIATAFGLVIAIVALIPFNYLNAALEERRHELEDAATRIELLLRTGPPE